MGTVLGWVLAREHKCRLLSRCYGIAAMFVQSDPGEHVIRLLNNNIVISMLWIQWEHSGWCEWEWLNVIGHRLSPVPVTNSLVTVITDHKNERRARRLVAAIDWSQCELWAVELLLWSVVGWVLRSKNNRPTGVVSAWTADTFMVATICGIILILSQGEVSARLCAPYLRYCSQL